MREMLPGGQGCRRGNRENWHQQRTTDFWELIWDFHWIKARAINRGPFSFTAGYQSAGDGFLFSFGAGLDDHQPGGLQPGQKKAFITVISQAGLWFPVCTAWPILNSTVEPSLERTAPSPS